MEIDDGIKSKNGVVASLRDDEDSVTLIFDDVESNISNGKTDWRHKVFFTSNTYDKSSFTSLKLSQEQFAEIGENLIIRLLALEGKLSKTI